MKKSKSFPLIILIIVLMSGSAFAQSQMKRTTKPAEYKAYIQKKKATTQATKAKTATRQTNSAKPLSAQKKAALYGKIKPKVAARMEARKAERVAKSKAAAARFKNRKQTN